MTLEELLKHTGYPTVKALENACDDDMYYSHDGPVSAAKTASGFKKALTNPDAYGKPDKRASDAKEFGKYLHTYILEPERIPEWYTVTVKSINTQTYRKAPKPCALEHWKEEAENIKQAFMAHPIASRLLNNPNKIVEKVGFGEINGHVVKGMADGIDPDELVLWDVKTTVNISDPARVIIDTNIHLQMWLYLNCIFEEYKLKRCLLLFASKNTLGANGLPDVKVVELSKEMLEEGRKQFEIADDIVENIIKPSRKEDVMVV